MAKPLPQARTKPRRRRKHASIEAMTMAESDARDKAYWQAATPAARLRELERLRQLNYGYGQGKPLPRLQRILRIAELGAFR
jgi:hypothetical protein